MKYLILIALFLASCTPTVYLRHQDCVEDMKLRAACRYLDGRDSLIRLYERLERIEKIERGRE